MFRRLPAGAARNTISPMTSRDLLALLTECPLIASVQASEGSPVDEPQTLAKLAHASRREGPGMAEIHTRDTDIVHVLGGTATLVTGGMATNTKTIAPEEIRGDTISNGESRHLAPGDVVVIPNGVPHQFRDVTDPLTYYVVKVRSSEGGM